MAADADATRCIQCSWQSRAAAASSERCAECAQWSIALNVGGIPGRSLLARRPLALGDTILTEPRTLWHCDIEAAGNGGDLGAINRADTMEGAYRQLLRQVAASIYLQPNSDSGQTSASTVQARRQFEQLHCVSESAFLAHHAEDDEEGRAESLRAVTMAKEVFALFQSACAPAAASACAPSAASSFAPSPSSSPATMKLCASESDFVGALIRFKLNAWSFSVPALSQTRINIVPHIAVANHSCCPNSVVLEGRRSVALRDIAEGEPITLSYLGIAALRSMSTAERRKRLWKDWIFRCECERCTSTQEEEGGPMQRDWDRELQEIESAAAKLAPMTATEDAQARSTSEEGEEVD